MPRFVNQANFVEPTPSAGERFEILRLLASDSRKLRKDADLDARTFGKGLKEQASLRRAILNNHT